MNDDIITNKLSEIFNEILDLKQFEFNLTMGDVQEWDSLRHIQLLSAIEEAFGIEIQFEDTIEMVSVESIINKIKKYVVEDKDND